MPQQRLRKEYPWTVLVHDESMLNDLCADFEDTLAPKAMFAKANGPNSYLRVAFEKNSIHKTTSITGIKPGHLEEDILYIPPSIPFKRRLTQESDNTKGTFVVSYNGGEFCIPGVSLVDDGETVTVYTVDKDGMKERGFTLSKQTGLRQMRTPGVIAWQGANIERMERVTHLHPSHPNYKSTNSASTAASHNSQLSHAPTGAGSTGHESNTSQYGHQDSLLSSSGRIEEPDALLAAMVDPAEDVIPSTSQGSEHSVAPLSDWFHRPIGFTPINHG
jgi:hypothetical protein